MVFQNYFEKNDKEWEAKIKRPKFLPKCDNPRRLLFVFVLMIPIGFFHCLIMFYMAGTYGVLSWTQRIGHIASLSGGIIFILGAICGGIILRSWIILKRQALALMICYAVCIILGIVTIILFLVPLTISGAKEILKDFVHANADVPIIMEEVQRKKKCCGISNWTDYVESKELKMFYANKTTIILPRSCCKSNKCRGENATVMLRLKPEHIEEFIYKAPCMKDKISFDGVSHVKFILSIITVVTIIFPIYPLILIGIFVAYWKQFASGKVDPAEEEDSKKDKEIFAESPSLEAFFGVYAPISGKKVLLDAYPLPWEKEKEKKDEEDVATTKSLEMIRKASDHKKGAEEELDPVKREEQWKEAFEKTQAEVNEKLRYKRPNRPIILEHSPVKPHKRYPIHAFWKVE